MSMRPTLYSLIVQPSLVDNNENQRDSGLVVVTDHEPKRKVHRGVAQRIGSAVTDEIVIGSVVHYTAFTEIRELHAVLWRDVVAWEDDE